MSKQLFLEEKHLKSLLDVVHEKKENCCWDDIEWVIVQKYVRKNPFEGKGKSTSTRYFVN